MSTTRWGWSGASDLADITGEGENSSGIPGEAMAAEDSRDGSQTATKDDPKVWQNKIIIYIVLGMIKVRARVEFDFLLLYYDF